MPECPGCKAEVRVTTMGKYYKHSAEDGDTCDWSGVLHEPPHYSADDPFDPPPRPKHVSEAYPMTPLGKQVADRLKELFYAYGSRRSTDNRSAQLTVGPSEVGTPCDRRLALSLLRRAPVNPGGDGWAAFVGTCVHRGLADMFVWAGQSTGRYAVEIPLTFDSEFMPKGTGDLLDRVLYLFADHKLMGRSSLERLRTSGPSLTYRVQVMLYAYAARMAGETVENVAIVGWPREGASLDDLYVWAVPYDPKIAADALARVERIGQAISADEFGPARTMEDFSTADDCKYCPHHGPSSCHGSR